MKPSFYILRILATIAGYIVGFHQLAEGIAHQNIVHAVLGVGFLFFVAVLGERPKLRKPR